MRFGQVKSLETRLTYHFRSRLGNQNPYLFNPNIWGAVWEVRIIKTYQLLWMPLLCPHHPAVLESSPIITKHFNFPSTYIELLLQRKSPVLFINNHQCHRSKDILVTLMEWKEMRDTLFLGRTETVSV